MKRVVTIAAIVMILVASPAIDRAQEPGEPRSLGDALLKCCGLPPPGLPAKLTARPAVDAAILYEGESFVAAYWTSLDRGSTAPLYVVQGRVGSATWREAQLPAQPRRAERSPIASIKRLGPLLFINLAYSPDNYAIRILTADLEPRGTIYGVVTEVWPNGLVEYEPWQPRHGPHRAALGVFDVAAQIDRQIYPTERCSPVRCGYVDRLVRAEVGAGGDFKSRRIRFGESWIDTRAEGRTVFDWKANALAMQVVLGPQSPYISSRGWSEEQAVMVACDGLDRIESIECHETDFSVWQKWFPGLDAAGLVRHAAANPRLIR